MAERYRNLAYERYSCFRRADGAASMKLERWTRWRCRGKGSDLRTSDYSASRGARRSALEAKAHCVGFHSVRQPQGICGGCSHPDGQVSSATAHYEIWSGEIAAVHKLSTHIG